MKKSNKPRISDLIIFKNHHLIAFNKPNGLAVHKSRQADVNLSTMAMAYAKRDLYLINRLDQVVSGVVLFAKDKQKASKLNKLAENRSMKKTYYAIVENQPEFEEKKISLYLKKNAARKKTEIVDSGEMDYVLNIRYLGSADHYHLLEIEPDGGFFHQIRASLSHIGHPVKGDVKYGARRKNTDRSIHLHAFSYEFEWGPRSEKYSLRAPAPSNDALWDFFQVRMRQV